MMKHKKAGCFVILDSDLDREWLKASQSFNFGKKKDSALLKRVQLWILKHVQTAVAPFLPTHQEPGYKRTTCM